MFCFWAGQSVQMLSADLLTYWRVLPVVLFRARAGRAEPRMRILFLDQFSELGGAQHALLDTVDAVQLAGWEPRVLVPGRGPLVEALDRDAVPVGEIPCGPYALGTQERRGFAAFRAGSCRGRCA